MNSKAGYHVEVSNEVDAGNAQIGPTGKQSRRPTIRKLGNCRPIIQNTPSLHAQGSMSDSPCYRLLPPDFRRKISSPSYRTRTNDRIEDIWQSCHDSSLLEEWAGAEQCDQPICSHSKTATICHRVTGSFTVFLSGTKRTHQPSSN